MENSIVLSFFQMGELAKLEREFKSTCWHKAGHSSVEIDALEYVFVKKSTKLNIVDGGAEIPGDRIPKGRVASVALAGCMAEAKRDAELKFGNASFELNNWDFILFQVAQVGQQIDAREPYALFPIHFYFDTPKGRQLASGAVTARDLLNIPPDEDEERNIWQSLEWVAKHLDQQRTWNWIGALGQELQDHPGHVYFRDEIIQRWGRP